MAHLLEELDAAMAYAEQKAEPEAQAWRDSESAIRAQCCRG